MVLDLFLKDTASFDEGKLNGCVQYNNDFSAGEKMRFQVMNRLTEDRSEILATMQKKTICECSSGVADCSDPNSDNNLISDADNLSDNDIL